MPSVRLNRFTLAALGLNLLPLLLSFSLLLRYSHGVPMFDDYHAILGFVMDLRAAPTLAAKALLLITAQHNEYKLIFEHLVVVAQYLVTGNVNFSFLIWAGNFFILPTLWIVWRNAFPTRQLATRLLLFLPVTCLITQLNYVETQDWAMCGLQTFPAICFSLATIHLLLRTRSFAWACLCAVLACFSSVHAFLLAPVGFLLLLQRRATTPHAWSRLAFWTLTLSATLALYLYRYTPSNLTNPNAPLSAKLLFFLSFLGASLENMHRFPIPGAAIVLGALLLLLLLHALRSGVLRTQPFFVYATLWILLTAALVAYGRSGLGISGSLTSRYKIYCDLLLSFAYIYLARLTSRGPRTPASRKRLYAAALAATGLLTLSSDFLGARYLAARRDSCIKGFAEYFADPISNPPMIGINGGHITGTPEPEYTRVTLTQVLQQHLYTYPPP